MDASLFAKAYHFCCLLRLTISVANHAQGRAAMPLGMDHFDVWVCLSFYTLNWMVGIAVFKSSRC